MSTPLRYIWKKGHATAVFGGTCLMNWYLGLKPISDPANAAMAIAAVALFGFAIYINFLP